MNGKNYISHYLSVNETLLSIIATLFFSPPNDKIVNIIFNKDFINILNYLNITNISEWEQCINNLSKVDNVKDEITLLYSKLFSVPGDDYIKLYESYYKDIWVIPFSKNTLYFNSKKYTAINCKNLLYGETAILLKKIYASEGIKIRNELRELPDHISCEIHFLRFLIMKQIKAMVRNKKKISLKYANQIKIFIKEHLSDLANNVRIEFKKRKQKNLYSVLIDILIDTLDHITKIESKYLNLKSKAKGEFYYEKAN